MKAAEEAEAWARAEVNRTKVNLEKARKEHEESEHTDSLVLNSHQSPNKLGKHLASNVRCNSRWPIAASQAA